MADSKISQLAVLTSVDLYNDTLPIVDANETNILIKTKQVSPASILASAGLAFSINDIGTPGGVGYGVGICPPALLPAYMVPLSGTYILGNDQYGNYKCTTDNSIMVWIPAFWYKIVNNTASPYFGTQVLTKTFNAYTNDANAAADGYVMDRAFIDGGATHLGVFVDKYNWSMTGYVAGATGRASSIALGNPISSSAVTKANKVINITGATYASGAVTVTANGHGFQTGNTVIISGVTGMPDLHGTWIISTITTNTFNVTLTTANTYTSGGTAAVQNFPGSFSDCLSNSQSPADIYGGAWAAAKSRGNNFAVMSIFIRTAIGLLSLAHGQAASSSTNCAWYDGTYAMNYPKGNNNLGADVNDSSVTFTACTDGYWGPQNLARKNGSGSNFAKTTHNGQNCGISDINGNQYDILQGLTTIQTTIAITAYASTDTGTKVQITAAAHGLTVGQQFGIDGGSGSPTMSGQVWTVSDVIDANNFKVVSTNTVFAAPYGSVYKATFYVLKESVAIASITGGDSITTSDHFNATFISNNFDAITIPFANGTFVQRYGNGTYQVLDFSTTRTSSAYKRGAAGLPQSSNSVSTGGTNEFGQDYFYEYFQNELCPIGFGDWYDTTNAGMWDLNLRNDRSNSSSDVSGRSCLYV